MPDKLFRCLSCSGFDYLEFFQADFHVSLLIPIIFEFAYFSAQ